MRGEAVKVLDEDLFHDGRVGDGKPGSGHVVEAVYSTILLSPLHVQLGVVDLIEEYFCYFIREWMGVFFCWVRVRVFFWLLT